MVVLPAYFIFKFNNLAPFDQGKKAGEDGVRIYANPYKLLTQKSKHKEWNDGWNSIQKGKTFDPYPWRDAW